MSRSTRPVLIALVTTLVSGLLVATAAAPADAAWITPKPGVTTNNPLAGNRAQQRINTLIVNSIRSTPKQQKIRIASWNIRSDRFVNALIDAHHRGVSVRVVLDRGNANPDNPNQGVNRLKKKLAGWGNKWRQNQYKSGVRRCVSSCRGTSGIPHTKSFAFSKVAKARWVVINGSHNATDLAGTNQWNDVYTTRNRKPIYREFITVFNQMYRDRPVKQGYRVRRFTRLTTMMLPWNGRYTNGDPTMMDLNKIRCWGAKNVPNTHTKVRVAMTSWHGQRGVKIARKVRQLYDSGCNVKIIYAVMGNKILHIMRNGRRGRIPFRQVVQDFNNDGVYDRYLHTKVLTVRGHYGKNRRAWVTVNGSMNWSPVPLSSDEAIMRLFGHRNVKRYNGFIDRWYRDTPAAQYNRASARTAAGYPREIPLGATVNGVDPYAKFQEH